MSARPTQPSAHALRITSPATLEAIRNVFERAFPGREETANREDYAHDVVVKMLAHADPPETEEGCRFLCIKAAQDRAVDVIRQRTSRRKVNAGFTDKADSHAAAGPDAADALATRQQLAFVDEQTAAGNISEQQASILRDVAEGASRDEIAARLRIAQQTVRNEIVRARKELLERWEERMGTVSKGLAVGLFLLLLWNLLSTPTPRQDVAKDTVPKPEVPKTPEAPAPESRATELRRAALHACDIGEWKECVDGLDQAKALDPDGDAKPAVQDARTRAARATAAPEHHPAPRPQPRARGVAGEKGWQ